MTRETGPHDAVPALQLGTPAGEADAALVLIHGRGAPAQTMTPLVDALLEGVEAAVTVRLPSAAGHVWYPQRFTEPRAVNQPWLDSALAKIAGVLDKLEAAGIAPERTILGGFSQGACLALESFALRGGRLGGVLAYAGGLIGERLDPADYADSLAGTPVFLGCSDPDPHIPTGRVEESAAILRAKGADVDLRLYPALGHVLNEDELNAGRALVAAATARG